MNSKKPKQSQPTQTGQPPTPPKSSASLKAKFPRTLSLQVVLAMKGLPTDRAVEVLSTRLNVNGSLSLFGNLRDDAQRIWGWSLILTPPLSQAEQSTMPTVEIFSREWLKVPW